MSPSISVTPNAQARTGSIDSGGKSGASSEVVGVATTAYYLSASEGILEGASPASASIVPSCASHTPCFSIGALTILVRHAAYI